MLQLARRLVPRGRRPLHAGPPVDPGVLATRLASRAVVRFRGPEAARFLNSLLTNDLLSQGAPASSQPQRYAPTPNAPARAPPPRYAALLTPQGRFLYDLFLYRPAPRSQMVDRTGSAPQAGERPAGEVEGGDGEVTKFKCGGAVVGCTFDHRVCDAYSFNMFLVAWAAVARGTSIPLPPTFNRSFLAPSRPPPSCTAGTLAGRLFLPVSRLPPPPATAAPPTAFNRIYHVAAADVAALQASAGRGRTKLEAFTAHLWQLYSRAATPRQHSCCMGVVVDGRGRIYPDGTMRTYFGNVLTIPYGMLGAADLRDMPLADVAEDVHRWVVEAATGEHFRDLVDWVEALRPEPMVARAYIGGGDDFGEGATASCVVSSGLRLPFGEVDFGWGRPAFASYHFPWPGGTGYVMPMPSARGGGDWVVYVHAAPEVVKVMEEEPTVFRAPVSSEIFG
ncbi:Anthranilate N-benzoyltransferase protein 3 [Hordeum vulgare]|nr:Anthranilate N-benzoyltransferase protein 3 [Hordeum vulgare]